MFLPAHKFLLPKPFQSIVRFCLLLCFTYTIMGSCGMALDDQGEFIGHHNNLKWKKDIPLDMVFIPGGTFLMGGGVNQGVVAKTNITQTTTVGPLYVDVAPVTNAKYQRFLELVLANPGEYGLEEAYIKNKLIPDITVWKKDFPFMFMDDSFGENYCTDPRFANYPVVGITLEAAQQFARVRSIYRNKYLASNGLPPSPDFRLPTAAEYEYAAKAGRLSGQYPWGGPTVRDQKGKLLANFQVTKGDYAASGYTYTSPVKAFPPNAYGLYDMAGNVAEWCEDQYSPLLIHKSGTMFSPDRDQEDSLFRVIKGGSWKDYAYSLQTGAYDGEHKEVARSYIGFRCVMSAL